MENSPLTRQFDIRLKQLNQEIHSNLKVIRQHIQELEEVEQRIRPGADAKTGRNFAEFLNDALEEGDSPE